MKEVNVTRTAIDHIPGYQNCVEHNVYEKIKLFAQSIVSTVLPKQVGCFVTTAKVTLMIP